MSDRPELNWKHVALVFALVGGAAVASRFMEFAPNFAAVGAAALFAGYVLRRPMLALALPVTVMLVSDAAIGFYDLPMMAVVYASLALPALWSARWSRVSGLAGSMKVACAAAGTGIGFFVTTNLAWWVFWSATHTPVTLVQAYVDALPFLKYTLAGNLVFSAAFFGAHAMVRAAMTQRMVRSLPA